jgi:hypothetical protein
LKYIHTILTLLAAGAVVTLAVGQMPVATVDPSHHGNLAAAQQSIQAAFNSISAAQSDNNDHLGGHAQRAKELLRGANDEITAAASVADASQQNASSSPPFPDAAPVTNMPPSAMLNISGNWTIYADNVHQQGSSLKEVQLTQMGNIVSGTFHGPHQHGKLQGWINGTHVEFSTDTREVLTFRGEITPTGMSGLYGVNGDHAPWKAQRSN